MGLSICCGSPEKGLLHQELCARTSHPDHPLTSSAPLYRDPLLGVHWGAIIRVGDHNGQTHGLVD
eukprot:10548205-Lingulodinium_polyedra.AAC.1